MANVASVRDPQVIRFNLDSDFSGGAAFNYVLPSKAEILNVFWIRTDAVGGGAVTLRNAGANVAVIGTPANQFDIVSAANLQNVTVAASATLSLTAPANTTRGRLYITILPGI